MKIIDFRYSDGSWMTDKFSLNSQNLFVGKNAVGKSKSIISISEISAIISQRITLPKEKNIACYVILGDANSKLFYSFVWENRKITREELTFYNEFQTKSDIVFRDGESAVIGDEPVNPPSDKLLIHVRRDTVKYPDIEKLICWAEKVEGFSFNELDIDGDSHIFSRILSKGTDLYSMVKTLEDDESALTNIIDKAATLGYILESVAAVEISDLKKVVFKEHQVEIFLVDRNLSKGMFRTLYLLIYMEYISHTTKPSLLLIDDLCEGLDYDRSTKLGKLIFDFSDKNDIQLVASSNDSFLMDVVDLKYWNILYRDGKTVSIINHKNSPELFDSFRFTGLSNFDFFSSDYIKRHTEKK